MVAGKYVVLSSEGGVHFDLGFDFDDLSLEGHEIAIVGSELVDSVFLRPGVTLDFTASAQGQDKIYFEGVWNDYRSSFVFPQGGTSTMSLGRQIGEGGENATFRKQIVAALSDELVFADGTINTHILSRNGVDAEPIPDSETSLAPNLPEHSPAQVRMVNFTSDGMTFAGMSPGVTMAVVGGGDVDKLYINDGVIADATGLAGGKDKIYLRGSFSDYSKDVSNSGVIVLTRDHDGNAATPDEQVTVSARFGSNDDQLVFADGSISSSRALRAELVSSGEPDSVTTGDLGTLWDTSITTPGVASDPVVSAFGATTPDGAYETGDTITITATMSEAVEAGSSFNVVLDSGATVTLEALSEGVQLVGEYVIGASDQSNDLNVASYGTGNVADLDGNMMTSTELPPAASNIAANHDLLINALSLQSLVNGVTELDARSDIVVSAASGSEALMFTAENKTFHVRLVQQADGSGKVGFSGETADGSQTIVVEMNSGIPSFNGGTITLVDGQAVIDFHGDFDLSNNFKLEIDAGLFHAQTSGAASAAVLDDDITFSTVTPSASGVRAKTWDGSGVVDGATWFDGRGGDYLKNQAGAAFDLAGVEGIVVLGRDADETAGLVLDGPGRLVLTNFGADDSIYVDLDVSFEENTISSETVGIGSVDGGPPTVLLFASNDSQAAALISFEDNPDTSNLDESQLVATAFSEDELGDGTSDFSFESILDVDAFPVISG